MRRSCAGGAGGAGRQGQEEGQVLRAGRGYLEGSSGSSGAKEDQCAG